jgi:nucleotide-binding universal stress UspA family protein/uncharacterized protein YrrD
MFGRIIVPLDGTREAEEALGYATALAEKFDGSLTLMRAFAGREQAARTLALMQSQPPGGALVDPDTVQAVTDAAVEEGIDARAYLDGKVHDLSARGLRVSGVLIEEATADAIVSEAHKHHDAVIVMATHARGGIERLVFGSIANDVVHDAHVPVLLVRIDEAEAGDAETAPGPGTGATRATGTVATGAVATDDRGKGEQTTMDAGLGADVIGSSGKLGEVNRVIIDERSGNITDLVVKHGFIFGGERVIPLGHVTAVDGDGIHVDLDEQGFEGMNGFAGPRHGVNPDYIGPPDQDNEGPFRGNAALDQMVAMGPLGGIGGTGKPLGYPGGEQLSPDNLQRPAVERGTDILDADGEKVGTLGELHFSTPDGAPTRLTLRQGTLFKHDSDLPVAWVGAFGSDGIVLNVAKATVEAEAKPV